MSCWGPPRKPRRLSSGPVSGGGLWKRIQTREAALKRLARIVVVTAALEAIIVDGSVMPTVMYPTDSWGSHQWFWQASHLQEFRDTLSLCWKGDCHGVLV